MHPTPHRHPQLFPLTPPHLLVLSALMLLDSRSIHGMVLIPPSTIDRRILTRLPFDKPHGTTTLLYHPLLLPLSLMMPRATHCGHCPHPFTRVTPLQFPIISMVVSVFLSHLCWQTFRSSITRVYPLPFLRGWTLCSPSSLLWVFSF
jgi:hypothetical protein